MRAGNLNTRVTIKRRTGGVNDWGEPLPAGWEEMVKVWADVRFRSGIEAIKADAETSVVKLSARVRRRSDILPGMRAVIEGANYEIQAVLPDLRKRAYMDLVCSLEQ